MPKKLAVLAVHGMGKTERDFDHELKTDLRNRLGGSKWGQVSWQPVFYQRVLQKNQRSLMDSLRSRGDLDGIRLRQFMLYSFSDAASMESRPDQPGSVYEKIQEVILGALDDALATLEDARDPVIVVSHSLGCQVMSNYIWDAQRSRGASAGVFSPEYRQPIGKADLADRFRRLRTLRYWFTSGCNIPIFVAGMPREKIKPVKVAGSGYDFRWQNYYDPDDVLGWPLHPLNSAYRSAVHVDKAINAGGFFSSWNPLSHNEYWSDRDFIDPLEDRIRELLA